MTTDNKFKKKLVEQIKIDEQEALHQRELKKKYEIKDDVVVVEKNTSIKVIMQTLTTIIRIAITIVIFVFAVIGLASVVFPDTRECILNHANEIYADLKALLIIK